jgi:hypothetical protein
MKWNLKEYVTLIAAMSLMAVVGCMIYMFLLGVLDPTVDNKLVYDIIGPAFQTIVGGFIGLITGIHIGDKDEPK